MIGGDVTVTSEPGKGSVFTLRLPVGAALGVINDPYHPIKLYLDQPCQPGDSGALVDTNAGEGAGIYCGAMTAATGQNVGFAQHLEQAAEILEVPSN